ncbi:hypothetical protein MUN84_18470 [Hymenobacter sp. 5516J-16]|uniref:GAF domain-containing protein n=1 Tax=Hymenobacter sublimis TaxID=2933777 RepID=A0ABY4JBH2_9BACT|nr:MULTISPECIES: hypothetical protein [Hymenobacter]UOQ76505.1 hypothetical protein MUN84_18470 [Hymenobacter sp. 5516J-16]UPL50167.1 hypothetical protein MWH26_04470 [Hymenobacter sublimis]
MLHHDGVYAALCYLNRYTPHRYTGIYRFEDGLSRNVALVDRYNIQVQQGADVPLDEAFCSLVGRQQATLQLWNAPLNLRAWEVNTLVVFYCGVLICDKQGQIYGTLCHYDLDLCQEVPPLLPPLEAAAPLLYQALHATSAPATNQ